VRGGFNDNYYYQMIANIRRYKGVRPLPAASPPITIDLDGSFAQWETVGPEYRDHLNETLPRDEPGVSMHLHYRTESGRNEFVRLKVARDADQIYFLAETRAPISPHSDPNWMMLFLDTDQNKQTGWQGYDYLINWPALDSGCTTVKKNLGGWNWEEVGQARYRVEGCQLMIAVPRQLLGLQAAPLSLDFHWADNLQSPGDLQAFLTTGDTAPARRFDYRYQESSPNVEELPRNSST
jgi:hypothetical protein